MSQDELELQEQMSRALDGDKAAYALFLERVAKMVRRYLSNTASRRQCSPQQIEDLVQDVLIAVHEKKHTYHRDLPVTPWIFAIARYKFIDSVRSGSRQPQSVDFGEEILESIASDSVSGDEVSHRLDAMALLDTLPAKQREVLLLAKVEQLSLQEISERLQMSISNVKVTIHRAMAKLSKNSVQEVTDEEE